MSVNQANVWIAVSETVFQQIKDHINDPDYQGVLINLVRGLRRQVDIRTTSNMWKRPTIATKEYRLFSLVYGENDDLQAIRDALDTLSAELGNDFSVAGAWWWDGRQAGTQWELDQDGERTGNTTGTPIYPINATQLVKFMPDVYDEQSDSMIPATELTDVNLVQGQSQRRFV